ncbi:MAG: tetratricopeptide repeat protein [Spirochaetaceae bacterium]|jgi:tetratricopeptide (TPR) repeat protein|nr:tetratricopeptide repeat protein [Spirochaetaceae bacterium]
MPSLKQLEEFQKSFRRMGREPEVLIGLQQAPEDYPLPEHEPEGPDPFEAEAAAGDGDSGANEGFNFEDFADGLGLDDGTEADTGGENAEDDDFSPIGEDGALDFSAFLDSVPDDIDVPAPGESDAGQIEDAFGADTAEIPEENAPAGTPPADGAGDFSDLSGLPDFGDFGEEDAEAESAGPEVPGGLLDGLGEDLEQSRAETGPDDADMAPFGPEEFGGDGEGAIEMGGEDAAGGFDLPDEEFGEGAGIPPEDGTAAAEEPDGFDMSGIDLPDIETEGGIDLSSDTGGGFDTGTGADGSAPADDDDLSLNLPEESEEESALTAPSWSPDEDLPENAPSSDSFESFNIEGDAGLGTDLNPAEMKSDSGGAFGGLENFDLEGLDSSVFGSGVRMAPQAAPEAKGKRRGTAKATEPRSEEVEEISLSEEQYDKLLAAINSYPLNLRLAIEEIIAEQVVEPNFLSSLIKLLISGGSPKEAASLAGKILGRTIPIPKGFEKKTGEDLEEEQSSFSYIFVHKFLPAAAIFFMAILFAASLVFLVRQFIYLPIHAESIYRTGLERIEDGEYERANDRFDQAFRIRRVKNWFYRYAEAFQNERQYIYAEEKYDELLRWYPRDKKGALDYAAMETNLRNYPKAEHILRSNILDYAVDDQEGLLALGDNYLAWGEEDPGRYEDARRAYARLLERYGWKDPIVERMLLYFIRTDNLGEVIPLQEYFDEATKRKISPRSLAELGGYLLDKRLEETDGVPDANIPRIQGLRNLLLRAVRAGPDLPEAHYHLARYYRDFGNRDEERVTLENTLRVFDSAPEESPRRIGFRIDAERRMAASLINSREFFKAEEHLVKGIGIFEDALRRQRLSAVPEYGRLYADMGDLEYFTKSGDMETALGYYRRSEQSGWAPPEIRYRMGSAYYQLGEWEDALGYFFDVSQEVPPNRRLLHALGNVSYERGNFYAAQGYYSRLLSLLETERARFPVLSPNDRPDHMELAERLMVARNNMGVTMEALTQRTGNPAYRAGALGLYAESSRAWDALTRDPVTMVRSGAGEFSTPGINLAYLNSRNLLYPRTGYEPELYLRIDKDVLEPSSWEDLAPQGYRISELR